ncbi:MAG: hypothetical protein ACTHU0_02665 [Kofleriaceae bacterium]
MSVTTIIAGTLFILLTAVLLGTRNGRREVVRPVYSGADVVGVLLASTAADAYVGQSWETAPSRDCIVATLIIVAVIAATVLPAGVFRAKWWRVVSREGDES